MYYKTFAIITMPLESWDGAGLHMLQRHPSMDEYVRSMDNLILDRSFTLKLLDAILPVS